MTGATGVNMADVTKAWNKMDLHSKQFEAMIADQMDELKQRIKDRVLEASSSVEKFNSRWQSLKPKVDLEGGVKPGPELAEEVSSVASDGDSSGSASPVSSPFFLPPCHSAPTCSRQLRGLGLLSLLQMPLFKNF